HQRVVGAFDVRRLGRRADADHRGHTGAVVGGGDDGRTAERVSDQQSDVAALLAHELPGAHGVGDLAGERPVAPIPFGVAESEVVEAQHADALGGQLFADPTGGGAVL